jgi:hypothetical protein
MRDFERIKDERNQEPRGTILILPTLLPADAKAS